METEAFALSLTPSTSATITTYTLVHIAPTVTPDTRANRAEAILTALESCGQDYAISLKTFTEYLAQAQDTVLLNVEIKGDTICKIRLVP